MLARCNNTIRRNYCEVCTKAVYSTIAFFFTHSNEFQHLDGCEARGWKKKIFICFEKLSMPIN